MSNVAAPAAHHAASPLRSVMIAGVSVWDTGEVVNLIVPGVDAGRLLDETGALTAALGNTADGPMLRVRVPGLIVAPGLTDPHVHLRDPGQRSKEDMRTGCAAAAAGGYTDVLLMPNTVPPIEGRELDQDEPGADEVLDAGCRTVVDYLQRYEPIHHVALPVRYQLSVTASLRRNGRAVTRVGDWIRATPGFTRQEAGRHPVMTGEPEHQWAYEHPVVAISDDGDTVPSSILEAAAAAAVHAGVPLLDHCEHHTTGSIHAGPVARQLGDTGVPDTTESAVVERDIRVARRTGAHVHLQHVSTAASFAAVRRAKREGLPVTCETAPHYLALDDRAVLSHGTLAKMNPPLRGPEDRQAALAAVADGTVDMIATDHAPHTDAEKRRPLAQAPNGIIGLETAYGVCRTQLVGGGWINDARLIELMAAAPARLLGRTPTDVAGLLNTSSRCAGTRTLDLRRVEHPERVDLALLAPKCAWTVDADQFHSKARNTPFDGIPLTGRAVATIIGSKLVFSRIRGNEVGAWTD